jgi:prepilin-type N-terminal cleavage/methylation domain-containing protein
MRRAFTLIEAMIVLAIVAIIAAIAIPNLMESKKNATPVENPRIDVPVGTDTYKAEKFDLEGHTYFLINSRTYHGFTAVHNPDCAKCKPVVKVTAEKVEQ